MEYIALNAILDIQPGADPARSGLFVLSPDLPPSGHCGTLTTERRLEATPALIPQLEADSTNKPPPDRSALAYILALTIVCGVLLFLAPAALVLLGVIAAFVLAVAWVKAGLRTGRWFFLRPTSALNAKERSAWMASAVIVLFGLAAIAYSTLLVGLAGDPLRLPLTFGDPPVGTRAVTYSDPQTQEALKRGLEASGVPHRVEKRDDGKEWISWVPKDNEAAEKVVRAVIGEPLPTGRNVSLGDARHEEEFMTWLSMRGVPNRRVMSHGKSFVVWEGDEIAEKLMEEFLRDQIVSTQARQQDCPKVAPGAIAGPAKKGC